MDVRDVESVVVYKDAGQACNQGSIIQLADGDMLMAFNQERGRVHSDSGQSCLIRSTDGGRSWDQAGMQVIWPFTDHGGNWDCALSQRADGTLLMHTRVCSFIAPTALHRIDLQGLGSGGERLKRQTGYALFRSADAGRTWEGPIPVNTFPIADSGNSAYMCGGSGAGHVVELPDGGLLMPLMGGIHRDGFTGSRGLTVGETMRCFALRSDDGGDNWEYWSTIAYDPAQIRAFQEPSVVRLSSGRLICMMRVTVRPERFDNMWVAHSDDDGITWSPPRRTALWGYPPDVLQLQDGRVLAVYGYRAEPMGVRGCVSENGLDWDLAAEFTICGCVGGPLEDPVYWHTGYPSVAQCPDGTLVAAYHEYSMDDEPIQYMRTTRFQLT